MECKVVRDRLDDGIRDAEVDAHLDTCPFCRAEAEFRIRFAAAVASIPRAPAPEGFTAQVMAGVQQRADPAHPPARTRDLALGPWEIGGIAALCLVLLSLLPLLWGRWPAAWVGVPGGTSVREWLDGATATLTSWRVRAGALDGLDLAGIGQSIGDHVMAWAGASLLWLCGAVAFVVAFYVLLSWRSASAIGAGMEDAHA